MEGRGKEVPESTPENGSDGTNKTRCLDSPNFKICSREKYKARRMGTMMGRVAREKMKFYKTGWGIRKRK